MMVSPLCGPGSYHQFDHQMGWIDVYRPGPMRSIIPEKMAENSHSADVLGRLWKQKWRPEPTYNLPSLSFATLRESATVPFMIVEPVPLTFVDLRLKSLHYVGTNEVTDGQADSDHSEEREAGPSR